MKDFSLVAGADMHETGEVLVADVLATAGMDPEQARNLVDTFENAYAGGEYEHALALLRAAFSCSPSLELELGVFAWRCETALQRSLDDPDLDAIASRVAWGTASPAKRLQLWFRRRRPDRRVIRCKWCGHYTRGRFRAAGGAPDFGGTLREEPPCRHCGRPYPHPDLYWDSMEGFAYCAGRGSWESHQRAIEAEWDEFYDRLKEKFPQRLKG